MTWWIDQALRAAGGAPTYLLTDNARTVTTDHIAGIPVRHPQMVALGRHLRLQGGDVRAVRPPVQTVGFTLHLFGSIRVLCCCLGGDGTGGV